MEGKREEGREWRAESRREMSERERVEERTDKEERSKKKRVVCTRPSSNYSSFARLCETGKKFWRETSIAFACAGCCVFVFYGIRTEIFSKLSSCKIMDALREASPESHGIRFFIDIFFVFCLSLFFLSL